MILKQMRIKFVNNNWTVGLSMDTYLNIAGSIESFAHNATFHCGGRDGEETNGIFDEIPSDDIFLVWEGTTSSYTSQQEKAKRKCTRPKS